MESSNDNSSAWDVPMQTAWSSGSDAFQALFALEGEDIIPGDVRLKVAIELRHRLLEACPDMPPSVLSRQDAFAEALRHLLSTLLELPPPMSVELAIAAALRAVSRLRLGTVADSVCGILYALHRGHWAPYLSTPRIWTLRMALAGALCALPPESLQTFWRDFESPDPMLQNAMRLGLEFLRAGHAVPHLLAGLESSREHTTRARIVDCLEQIAEPSAIPTLVRLRQATAKSDWTLSRHIARCIRVIEQQNKEEHERLLLRPSEAAAGLLRPATRDSGPRGRKEELDLLRPASSEDFLRGPE